MGGTQREGEGTISFDERSYEGRGEPVGGGCPHPLGPRGVAVGAFTPHPQQPTACTWNEKRKYRRKAKLMREGGREKASGNAYSRCGGVEEHLGKIPSGC